ncbi:hypothetical protein CHUAL_008222 [Chamberlinius hualienensis]
MLNPRRNSYKVKNIIAGIANSPFKGELYRQNDSQDNPPDQKVLSTDGSVWEKYERPKFIPKLYARRWAYLVIAAILNMSDGALWINYASVTNISAAYYDVSINSINFLSMIFFIVYIPVIFVAMLIIDRLGLKHAFYWGCGTNLVGSVIRLFGTFDFVPATYRYPVTLIGQTVASLAQPFCMCMPTQLSQNWFPQNQRTFATTIVSLSNLAGSMVASLISPEIAKNPEDVPTMNEIMCGFGIFAGVLGIFVRESKPESPPSLSAAEAKDKPPTTIKSYIISLKKLLLNKQFALLTFTAASTGVSLVYTLLTVLQQMLCSFDYSNKFSGLCTALIVAGGIIGSSLFTKLADKTNKLEEIVAISFSISVLIDIALVLLSNIRGIEIAIATVCVLVGFINLGVYPVCLEVAVEITYPIEQSLSAGIVACWQQIQSTAFIPLITAFAKPLNSLQLQHQTCTVGSSTEAYDMTHGVLCLVGLITFFNILLMVFFRPKYKRTELENLIEQQRLQLKNGVTNSGMVNDRVTIVGVANDGATNDNGNCLPRYIVPPPLDGKLLNERF